MVPRGASSLPLPSSHHQPKTMLRHPRARPRPRCNARTVCSEHENHWKSQKVRTWTFAQISFNSKRLLPMCLTARRGILVQDVQLSSSVRPFTQQFLRQTRKEVHGVPFTAGFFSSTSTKSRFQQRYSSSESGITEHQVPSLEALHAVLGSMPSLVQVLVTVMLVTPFRMLSPPLEEDSATLPSN